MMQRAIGSAFGMLTALALGACAQPASIRDTNTSSTDTGQPGVRIANPRVAEATDGGPFPALPSGYRGLGGAFMNQGSLIVVAPDMNAPMQKHDLDVALMHGIAAGHPGEKLSIHAADCEGRGDTPETAIKVANLAQPADEVSAGIACAKLLHPGMHWRMSQLISKGNGYISQVALSDGGGKTVIVYTDVNRLANQLIDELDG